MSLTSADLQYIAKLHRPLSGTIWHVGGPGASDSNDGLSFLTPFATLAKAVTSVTGSGTQDGILCAGVFDLATSLIVAPSNLALLEGVGRDVTIIKSQIANASVLRLCSGLLVKNLTIWGNLTPTNETFQYPISDDFFTFTNVVLENVRTIGDTDNIYLPGGSTVRAFHHVFSSNWDQAYVGNGGLLELFEPIGDTIAQNAASPATNSSYQAVDGAIIRIIRGALTNVSGNSQPTRFTNMLHARNSSAPGARIELHGGSAYMSVDGTTQINLAADTGCSVVDLGAVYDRSKTTGTITSYPYAGDVRLWKGVAPNPLSTLGNVPADMVENGGGFTPALNIVNGTVPSGSTPALNGQTITGAVNYPFSQSISVSNFNATSWTKLVFTVKANPSDADSAAVLTVQLSNPGSGSDGLTILNGAAPQAPVTAGDGAIVVNQANSSGLTCTVTLTARGMGLKGRYTWELAPFISGVKGPWLGSGQFVVDQTAYSSPT